VHFKVGAASNLGKGVANALKTVAAKMHLRREKIKFAHPLSTYVKWILNLHYPLDVLM
jgi:hypothetical protein